MNYKRPQYKILEKRIREPRKFIQIITGPRQVGKTTLVNQLLENLNIPNLYISADSEINTGTLWIKQQWEACRIKMKVSGWKKFILVIDEVQKIKGWSEAVKEEWDRDSLNQTNIIVVLLGSSALLLQKGFTESLTGRFEVISMNHWAFTEMHSAFGITENEYVWFGGYPGAVSLYKDEIRWKNYVKNSLIEPTLSKDILMLTRVDKPALLRNLFEIGVLHSGEILSYTKMLGQLQDSGNTTTLAHYLKLLSAAGILCGLERYSGSIQRQRSSSPKFQVYNTAFTGALSGYRFKEIVSLPEKWGRFIETAIGCHLINTTPHSDIKVYYWREGIYEVDFVLERNNQVVALEVKTGRIKSIHGIKKFAEKFNPSKVVLISKDSLSWQEFLRINPSDLF